MIWLRSHLYAIVFAAKALLLAALYFKGRKDAADKRAARDMRDYHETRERIDEVVHDSSVVDAADWLRNRGKRK